MSKTTKGTAKKGTHTVSLAVRPLSPQEKEELSLIVEEEQYWKRAAMKKQFLKNHGRIPDEITDILKELKKTVSAAEKISRAQRTGNPIEHNGVPKVPARTNEPLVTGNAHTIRIKGFKLIRMEDGEVIIDL